jgi:hypothetical protein
MDHPTCENCLELHSALADARKVLASKQADLELSATIGKRLLEDNHELSCRIEQTVSEYSGRLEVRTKFELAFR